MDNLHSVIRTIRQETKGAKGETRRDHLAVFREFLGHLDRIAKRDRRAVKSAKAGKRRKR